ncbi:hypothetical protein Hanom_Chr07g00610511 [Helianthus anomalus]
MNNLPHRLFYVEPVVPDSYDERENDDHAEEVIVPSGDHSYGCPDYEAGYGASYGQEDYGNNFFVSGSSCV